MRSHEPEPQQPSSTPDTTSAWHDQVPTTSTTPPISLSLNLRPGLLFHGQPSLSGGARRVSSGPSYNAETGSQQQPITSPTQPALPSSPSARARPSTAPHARSPGGSTELLVLEDLAGSFPSPSRTGPHSDPNNTTHVRSPDSSYSARHLAHLHHHTRHHKSHRSPSAHKQHTYDSLLHSPLATPTKGRDRASLPGGMTPQLMMMSPLQAPPPSFPVTPKQQQIQQQLQQVQQQTQQQIQQNQQGGLWNASSNSGTTPSTSSRPAAVPLNMSIGSSTAVMMHADLNKPHASAEDRRELLRQYKAAKEAKLAAHRPLSSQSSQAGVDGGRSSGLAGAAPGASRSGSLTARTATGRPPIPLHTLAPHSRLPTRPYTNPQQQAFDEGGVSHRSSSGFTNTNTNRSSDICSVPAHQQPPASNRSSGIFAAPAQQPPTSNRSSGIFAASAQQPASVKGGSSGAAMLSPPHALAKGSSATRVPVSGASSGATAGGVGSIVTVNGGGMMTHAASTELQKEMKQLRLQELQWRFINARVAQAMHVRQVKSERALASCALAITDMQSRVAVLSAQRARKDLAWRAEHACSVLRDPLDAWQEVEGQQQSALQPTVHAIQDSLTHVPLVGGARSGSQKALDLEHLQDVMDRGMYVLQVMASSLEPLLAAAVSNSSLAVGNNRASLRGGRPSDSRGSAVGVPGTSGAKAESEEQQLHLLPTATHLLGLAAAVQQEVTLLQECMASVRKLNDKQSLLASYQAQLLHMQRSSFNS